MLSESPVDTTAAAAPILRWAGGKRWLLSRLREIVVDFEITNYHEPFLGGGAVFFGLQTGGVARLSDLNAELIEVYREVRDAPTAVAVALTTQENTREHYYNVRASRPSTGPERAARFIYLNHTSFNGLHRVNLQGEYNVPYGNRALPNIPSLEQLHAVSVRLANAELFEGDFGQTAQHVQPGDLVFLDPPYTVAHNNNGFIKYNQRLFSFEDQQRLSELVDEVRARGAFYVLTNAAHESIARLFDKGDTRYELYRRNTIGGRQAARGTATEFLFTNLKTPHA